MSSRRRHPKRLIGRHLRLQVSMFACLLLIITFFVTLVSLVVAALPASLA